MGKAASKCRNSCAMSSDKQYIDDPITSSTALDSLLIVESDQAHIDSLQSVLEKLGFKILPALGGQQALEQLAATRPELILLKLPIPGMDGFELCKQIKENSTWSDIPIIFLSSNLDKTLLVRALESGGADYLTEPFDRAELVSRIRTHLMLQTTRNHLKQMAREKEELLGMISHHVQNNLAGMNMSARLLLERTQSSSDPKLRLMAENILASSSQMSVFIKALLANSAADRGLKITMESVDISVAASRSLRQYADAATEKQINLCANGLPEGVFISADPAALAQVFDNLISNAIKFSPSNTSITVAVQRNGDRVECRIQDQGPGFTDEDKLRMFHRYARLSARPTGGEPSTGLGLSIVKKLVEAMAGEVACQSALGKGTTFILSFPAFTPNSSSNS